MSFKGRPLGILPGLRVARVSAPGNRAGGHGLERAWALPWAGFSGDLQWSIFSVRITCGQAEVPPRRTAPCRSAWPWAGGVGTRFSSMLCHHGPRTQVWADRPGPWIIGPAPGAMFGVGVRNDGFSGQHCGAAMTPRQGGRTGESGTNPPSPGATGEGAPAGPASRTPPATANAVGCCLLTLFD